MMRLVNRFIFLAMLFSSKIGPSHQMDPMAKDAFDFWTPEAFAMAEPLEKTMDSRGKTESSVHGRDYDQLVIGEEWNGGGLANEAVGRIYMYWSGYGFYYCSATAISDGNTPGRSLVLTAAHCVYDPTIDQQWAEFIIFVPKQDDGGEDETDFRCSNDPYGCWVLPFGVIDRRWNDWDWDYSIVVDYAVMVVPDEGFHLSGYANSDPVLDRAVPTMEVALTNAMDPQEGSTLRYMGYPYGNDPEFLYCQDTIDEWYWDDYGPDYQGPWSGILGWELPYCTLGGGASGSPGVTSENSLIYSVLSYGYTGYSGQGGPTLFDNSFSCVYQRARSAPLDSTGEMLDYGGTPCVKKGGTWGDPHFQTWDGRYFDFMGICDLVLVDAPSFGDGLGFTAHVRTKERYGYSYIESAAVKIGDDIIEVGAYGSYMMNGISQGSLSLMGGKFTIVKVELNDHDIRFEIDTENGSVITIKAFKDLVSIMFTGADAHHFDNATGMMGDFHNGTHYSRSCQEIILDDTLFGQEWQVRPGMDPVLFQVESDVQWPAQTCIMPDETSNKRRLGESIATEAATKACAAFKTKEEHDACIYDVIATGDLDAAQAGAY